MYSCILCEDRNFPNLQSFYKHLIDHKSRHGCRKCDEIITGFNKRRSHNRKHAQVTCNICNTEYEKLNREDHTRSHEYLYSVDQLNGIVDIINEMQDIPPPAKRRKTTNITEYRGTEPNCPVKKCDEKFDNQNDLINHFIHHRKHHLCEFCGEIFSDNASLDLHKVDKICRIYSCHICDKKFSFNGFIRHILTECGNKNLFDNLNVEPVQTYNNRKIYQIDDINYRFICFVCEEEYNTIELLNNHLNTHNKELNVCIKCFCVFNTEQELVDHTTIDCKNEELSENIREKITKEIEQFFEKRASRRNHLIANKKVYELTDDSVLYQCNVCESKFVKFSYLKDHCAKFKHELILCYKCLYLFNSWDEFREHYCIKLDYNSFGELEFRQQFQKCIKRNYAETEITLKDGKPFEADNLNKKNHKKEMNNILNNNDLQRMSILIHQLENTKFTNIKVTKSFKVTPGNSVNSNDDYDLNKILPRILERRNKRLFQKPNSGEDSEEELDKIGNNLNDLDISKKHLLINNDEYDLDKVLPRIFKLRNKRHVDEIIDDIDISEDLEYPDNQGMDEPPNKRNKNETNRSEGPNVTSDICHI